MPTSPGPRDALGGPSGLWRAQLGTRWHQQLRERTAGQCPTAEFEVQLQGRVAHRGWVLTLTGRIDQLLDRAARLQQQELETRTATLTSLLEPLLLLVMGAVVLLIVLAVMQPIIEINTLMR